jgi:hypothetical protein
LGAATGLGNPHCRVGVVHCRTTYTSFDHLGERETILSSNTAVIPRQPVFVDDTYNAITFPEVIKHNDSRVRRPLAHGTYSEEVLTLVRAPHLAQLRILAHEW